MTIKGVWPAPNPEAPRVHQLSVMLAAERKRNRVVSEQYAKSLELPADLFARSEAAVIELMEVELEKAKTETAIGQSIDEVTKKEEAEAASKKAVAKAKRDKKKKDKTPTAE